MNDYKKLASFYDFVVSPFVFSMRKQVTFAALRAGVGKTVDLCCGTGRQLKILKNIGFNDITGIDSSRYMLSVANKGKYGTFCVFGDASNTKLKAGIYDLALINLALHEKERQTAEAILDEAFRLLKKDGSLIVADYSADSSVPHYTRLFISYLESLAGKNHFANYRRYLDYGGLPSLFQHRKDFQLISEITAFFGGFIVTSWRKL